MRRLLTPVALLVVIGFLVGPAAEETETLPEVGTFAEDVDLSSVPGAIQYEDALTMPLEAAPLCGTAKGSRKASPARARLRVATLNVLHGLAEEEPQYPTHSTLDARLAMTAEQVAAADVDIVGMQEVSDTVDPDGHHEDGLVVKRLAEMLAAMHNGFTWHWCWYLANPYPVDEKEVAEGGGGGPAAEKAAGSTPGPYEDGGVFKEGIAILSRYQILESEARRLPRRIPEEQAACLEEHPDDPTCVLMAQFESRVALWAKIKTPGGAMQIVATHLSHGITSRSAESAQRQLAAALAFSDEKADADSPALRFFACDCNLPKDLVGETVAQESPEFIDTFRALNPDDLGLTGGQDVIVTKDPERPMMTERIDYVLGRSGSCALQLVSSRLFLDEPILFGPDFLWASDHLGVLTTVSIAGC